MYIDYGLEASRKMRVLGLPATIVLDRQGREVGRMHGATEWDSDEAVALLRHLLESGGAPEAGDARSTADPS